MTIGMLLALSCPSLEALADRQAMHAAVLVYANRDPAGPRAELLLTTFALYAKRCGDE